VSEYQYYEFLAIDRPLDERAMAELRAITSRAEITPTSLINVYHWGDFKGDPWELMAKYFDAFVYVANWGTNRLMLRLPRRLLDKETASVYACDEGLTLKARGEWVLLDFLSQDEGGGEWMEGEGWMASLAPLRNELMAGDLRCLYLGWLMGVQQGLIEEGAEPLVPPGLAHLSGPQQRLVEFLRIDDDLLKVAARTSSGEAPAGPSSEELAAWMRALPEAEKTSWLLRLVEQEGRHLRAELVRAYHEAHRPVKASMGRGAAPREARRTVEQLVGAWQAFAEEERRREAERQERERQRRAEEKARARAAYLDSISGREETLWGEVETLIGTKQPKPYDEAVQRLTDLRDLAERESTTAAFRERLRQLRERHQKKPSLMQRLDKAGLTT
jgi:hypothetical protein